MMRRGISFRLLGRVGGLFPGVRRKRAMLDELARWAADAPEHELLDAVARSDLVRRRHAVWQLCARDPERPAEPIVTAARRGAGREPRPDEPPGARELLELGLAHCDCKGLRSLELFSAVLLDAAEDSALRAQAATVLGVLDDPRAVEALRAATTDPNRSIRRIAGQVLSAKEALDY